MKTFLLRPSVIIPLIILVIGIINIAPSDFWMAFFKLLIFSVVIALVIEWIGSLFKKKKNL
ncbi:hypothetical protein D5F52_08845 [Brevibacillus laterosporus]|nr:hypothetical protein BrL25_21350 [Brevibacillus laterosporus DSM 25]AYB38355.1 hypothetical protein D5F52_08845 [Brevibacillus laterosporus]MBG9790410.1 hypothetical protein [Brevibacillus laterosporus]MBG9797735.1 hypothetical protein [Brevibacillus laterosporus]PPA86165.1 hypothetical protein C4A75_06180 [Brevibacillus laterosporus]